MSRENGQPILKSSYPSTWWVCPYCDGDSKIVYLGNDLYKCPDCKAHWTTSKDLGCWFTVVRGPGVNVTKFDLVLDD